MAVRDVDDRLAAQVDARLLRDSCDPRRGADENGRDQLQALGVERAFECRGFARMRDCRRDWRKSLAPFQELFVLATTRRHVILCGWLATRPGTLQHAR